MVGAGGSNVEIASSLSIDAGSDLLLDEAVALRQRHELVRADALDEVVEMLADARFGARAVRRLQQHLDGEIERRARLLEMAQGQLALARGKMALRLGNQVGDRVVDRGRLRLAHVHDRGQAGRDRRLDRLRRAAAPDDRYAYADSGCHGQQCPQSHQSLYNDRFVPGATELQRRA